MNTIGTNQLHYDYNYNILLQFPFAVYISYVPLICHYLMCFHVRIGTCWFILSVLLPVFKNINFIFEAENVRTDLLNTFQLICNANHVLTCFNQNLSVREHNVKTRVNLTHVQDY